MTTKIPQVLVTLSPDGGLQLELPASGSRIIIRLTTAEAGKKILRILNQQKARLDAESTAPRAPRKRAQPDWTLIAKHPQAEIREVTARRIPAKDRALREQSIAASAEDLGL